MSDPARGGGAGRGAAWRVMEVCGGQTHTILRWGLDQRLPKELTLIHGPGCPVCVTPTAILQAAHALACCQEVILCTYGDMLRVPVPNRADPDQSSVDLLTLRAAGADVRLITQPLQALQLALEHPQRQVVVLAVGFETTAPATAVLARQMLDLSLDNLHLLVAHVRVVPAMAALLEQPGVLLDAFLAPGHVCSVIGLDAFIALAEEHRRPMVVAGFTPAPLEAALLQALRMLERGEHGAVNAYPSVVQPQGNQRARALLAEVFEPIDLNWRGLGLIRGGGLALRGPYARFDGRWSLDRGETALAMAPLLEQLLPTSGSDTDDCDTDRSDPPQCRASAVLQGRCLPSDCPSFGQDCTPDHPLGAPMVSDEGACAAWMQHRRPR